MLKNLFTASLSLLIIFSLFNYSSAQADYAFPTPEGKYQLTQAYGPDYSHHGYELDIVAGKLPDNLKKELRCYTYGIPILATQGGTVTWIEQRTDRRKRQNPGSKYLGQAVIIKHADNSYALYAHMITDTPQAFVKVGQTIKTGQIIGLMGDTGDVSSKAYTTNEQGETVRNLCTDTHTSWGTHLHFGIFTKYPLGLSADIIPEPLGHPDQISLKKYQYLNSYTQVIDAQNVYVQKYQHLYDFKLENVEVYWIHPLQASIGTELSFVLQGKNFTDNTQLTLPFCEEQETTVLDHEHAHVDCQISSETGLKEGVFSNSKSETGQLKHQVELQSSSSGSPEVSDVKYISPKPGEYFNLHITGKNFSGNLYTHIQSRNNPGENGQCDTTGQTSFLSPGSIKTRCLAPLDLGPAQRKDNEIFDISIYLSIESMERNDPPIYTNKFDVNYGVSAAELSPLQAVYFIPTKFTITGKNIHRTKIFHIDNCNDLKVVSQSYDRIEFECVLQPPIAGDPAQLEGQSFRHKFLFKTKSIYNDNDEIVVSESEDQANTVLSGYIDVYFDTQSRIDSISPKTAIVGDLTSFTILGNHLPFSKDSELQALAWMADCPGTDPGGKIRILPESYSPYGFEFQCTPQFRDTPTSKNFDLNTAQEKCFLINQQDWNETDKNAALEKCYDFHDQTIKESLWPEFEKFFNNLITRPLVIKQLLNNQKDLVSKQEVKFISALYNFIQKEEKFLFNHPRQEGEFLEDGPTKVTEIKAGAVYTANREQRITIYGKSLPKTLELFSDDCIQTTTVYASSEKYTFVCLLDKVSVLELRVINTADQSEVYHKTIDVIEVYEVLAAKSWGIHSGSSSGDSGKATIAISGVNLSPNLHVQAPECRQLEFLEDPSTSQVFLSCDLTRNFLIRPSHLNLEIFSSSNVLLFKDEIKIRTEFTFSQNFEVKKLPFNAIPIVIPTEDDPDLPEKLNDFVPFYDDLINVDLLRLNCEINDDEQLFIGACALYSAFIRSANILASYDRLLRTLVVEGKFSASPLKKIDNQLLAQGIKVKPLTGEGIFVADLNELYFLFNGTLTSLGLDLEEALGFPFEFDLYEYGGNLLFSYPNYEENFGKDRSLSRIVIGAGNIPQDQLLPIKKYSDHLKNEIDVYLESTNRAINKKKFEYGAKITNSIDDLMWKNNARESIVRILKALEIIPEQISFYDNLDFVAKGRLKSEPFRPKNWSENKEWIAEFGIADFSIDFTAQKGQMIILGSALNKLTLFNNHLINNRDGVVNAKIIIDLLQHGGAFSLENLTVTIPGDLAQANASLHFQNIFSQDDGLHAWGNLNSEITPFGISVAEAGAYIEYDPNSSYTLDDYQSLGILRADGKMIIGPLDLFMKTIFTLPAGNLTMDYAGSLDFNFDFLNVHQHLGEVIGRNRFYIDKINSCMNSKSGVFKAKVPKLVSPIFEWAGVKLNNNELKFEGGINIKAEVPINVVTQDFSFAISGQINNQERQGFEYDPNKGDLIPIYYYDDICTDLPDENFLEDFKA